jgi:hypothetical protein
MPTELPPFAHDFRERACYARCDNGSPVGIVQAANTWGLLDRVRDNFGSR